VGGASVIVLDVESLDWERMAMDGRDRETKEGGTVGDDYTSFMVLRLPLMIMSRTLEMIVAVRRVSVTAVRWM